MSILGRLFKRKKRDDTRTITIAIAPRTVNLFDDPPPPLNMTGFWSDNKLYETSTWNEVREMAGMEPIESEETEKRKRCEYCGCLSDKDFGTCEHCGAPL